LGNAPYLESYETANYQPTMHCKYVFNSTHCCHSLWQHCQWWSGKEVCIVLKMRGLVYCGKA